MKLRYTAPLWGAILMLGAWTSHAQQMSQSSAQGMSSEQGSAVLHVSPATVQQIQMQLGKEGFDPNRVDGIWGPETSQALQNFQRTKGIEPTGTLTLETMEKLGRIDAISGKQGQQDQGGQKLTQEAEQAGGAPVYIGPNGVRQIEQKLQDQGQKVSSVDGQWDSDTAQALSDFQRSKGITATGQLNLKTLSELGIDLQQLGKGGQSGQDQSSQQQSGDQRQAMGSGVQIHFDVDTVRKVQQALNKAGFDAGSVDGTWGPGTETAIRNFQRERKLEQSGNLNPQTLEALGMSDMLSGSSGGSGGQTQSGNQQSTSSQNQ